MRVVVSVVGEGVGLDALSEVELVWGHIQLVGLWGEFVICVIEDIITGVFKLV